MAGNKPPIEGVSLYQHKSAIVERKSHSINEFIHLWTQYSFHMELVKIPIDTKVPLLQLEMTRLMCPMCQEGVKNTSELLIHYLSHFYKPATLLYDDVGLIRQGMNEALERAMTNQEENSFVLRKVTNGNFIMKCRLDSPLASFLAIQDLDIYLNQRPERSEPNLLVTTQFLNDHKTCVLFFDFTWIRTKLPLIKKALKPIEEEEPEQNIAFTRKEQEPESLTQENNGTVKDRSNTKIIRKTEYLNETQYVPEENYLESRRNLKQMEAKEGEENIDVVTADSNNSTLDISSLLMI